jgi:hypothetical protein
MNAKNLEVNEKKGNEHADRAVAEVIDEVHGHKEQAEACGRNIRTQCRMSQVGINRNQA